MLFSNSGSEANDLAFRMAHQHTGARGILVTDHSYHGHTSFLTEITTGLKTHEPLGDHVRTFHVPDLDEAANRDRSEQEILTAALAEVEACLADLVRSGHGVSAVIVETIFSTEGLPRVPEGYVTGIAQLVRQAGGLVIADEVQAGLGRIGSHFWGYQKHGIVPDFVTMGKPLGNGHPLAGVVTTAELLEEFGARNEYFNTFAGTPVSSAVGHEVLKIVDDEALVESSERLGALIRPRMAELVEARPQLGVPRGSGLFFGFSVFSDADQLHPDAQTTRQLVEAIKARGVLLSKIGPTGSVLKIRPPLALREEHLPLLLGTIEEAVDEVLG